MVRQYIGRSKLYKHVYIFTDGLKLIYNANLKGRGSSKVYDTEKEAALQADKMLLCMGKPPVNILVRK